MIIDAFNECDFGFDQLLHLVFHSGISSTGRVKWLVTSHNESFIKEITITESYLSTSLELNSDYVVRAVYAFIEFKASILARRKRCSTEL